MKVKHVLMIAAVLLAMLVMPVVATGSEADNSDVSTEKETHYSDLTLGVPSTYIVDVPPTITFAAGATIVASDVLIGQDSALVVTVKSGNTWKLYLNDRDFLNYKMYIGDKETQAANDDAVINIAYPSNGDVVKLTFTTDDTAKKSGDYKDTLTFTVEEVFGAATDANADTVLISTIDELTSLGDTDTSGKTVKLLNTEENPVDSALLSAAVGLEGTTIHVYSTEEGTSFPSGFAEDVTLICEEGTVFDGTSSPNINGATVVGATFSSDDGIAVRGTVNGNFKDCVFDSSEALRWCYSTAGTTATFENCEIKTDFRGVHFDNLAGTVIFKNCKINGFNAFGGEGTVIFDGCTFGYDESSYNGLNMYMDLELKDCTFNYISGKTNFIDYEGSGYTLTIDNCKAELDGAAVDIGKFIGGSKIADTTVTIDGNSWSPSVAESSEE